MKKMKMFIPLTKVDLEQRLVYGIATCEKQDRSGEICDYETTKPYYEKWSGDIAKASGGKSLGNLRAMHGKVAAGKITDIAFNDDAKQIEICAKVVDDAEWTKVTEGVYTGFSHGGSYAKTWKDEQGNKRYTADPVEVSLVDIPCLPDATFTAVKADGATELMKFANVVTEPNMTQVGMKAEAMAKDAGEGHTWNEFTAAAHDALIQEQIDAAFEKAAAATDEEDQEDGADDEEAEGDNKKPKAKDKKGAKKTVEPTQVWKCNHADHNHLAKAEAVSCMKQDEANDLAKEATAPLADALSKLKDALTPVDPVEQFVHGWKEGDGVPADIVTQLAEKIKTDDALAKHIEKVDLQDVPAIMKSLGEYFAKRKFTQDERKAAAKSGAAMSDGSYPIENKSDLKNAISAYGHKPTPAVKRHIEQRAKALGAEDMLPDKWKTEDAGDMKKRLQKGLYSVGRLADIIQSLEWLIQDAKWERDAEGDNSTLPEQLKTDCASLCESLKAMVTEETAELFDGEEQPLIEIVVMEDAVNLDGLVKVLGDKAPAMLKMSLSKRVSPFEDFAVKFEKLRDTLPADAAGARGQLDKCAGMSREFGKAGARHSKKDVEMIQQMHDLASSLGADCGDASKSAESDALKKQLTDLVPVVQELTKQVEELRAQPAPAKAVTRVVGKSETTEGQGDAVAKANAMLDKMTPEERTAVLMKAALSNGVTLAQ